MEKPPADSSAALGTLSLRLVDSHRQRVVVFGGEGSREGTLIYDPWRNEWHWPRPKTEPPPRSGGSMAYDAERKLHILFGSQFGNDAHTWAYDAAKNEWRDMKPSAMPPTEKNDPELTYDPINKVILALVKVSKEIKGKTVHQVQTWSYDVGQNKWTRANPEREPDAGGNRTRNLVFAPELNLAILENCVGPPREHQIWTYRFDESTHRYIPSQSKPPQPPLVSDVVVSVLKADRIEIHWSPIQQESIVGYQIERALVEVWSDDQLVRLKKNTPPLASPSVGAISKIGPFQRISNEILRQPSFVDATVNINQLQGIDGKAIYDSRLHKSHLDRTGRSYRKSVYAYRIRAVDRLGKVGGPSEAVLTIPSSPQHLFSKEEGDVCHLKWKANPEKGISGYRVYRMDGRFSKAAIQRLTENPQRGTAFSDDRAGKQTRRFYVVAVDALGQEGFPSSPVWHHREWRAFYQPFVGDWHQ